MNDTLKLLYERFYTPLPLEEYEQEVETCHHQLIERLENQRENWCCRSSIPRTISSKSGLWTAFSAGSVWRGNWPTN